MPEHFQSQMPAKAKPQILKGTEDVILVDLPSNTWLVQFMRQSLRIEVVACLMTSSSVCFFVALSS